MQTIDAWISIGSTYSYLTVMRLDALAAQHGVTCRWRPFDVRHVMIAQKNIPFTGKPEKTAYMWRDIERRAPVHGLAPKLPAPYPIPDLALANRIALLGMREGWGPAYLRATYRRWFEDGEPAGADPNMTESLREIGCVPEDVLDVARSDEIVTALADATAEAMALGVFGSPSFVVGEEVFWGDDRAEDAITWAKHGRLA